MADSSRPVYVIDTNVLVDYVDIIPNGSLRMPENPTVDLRGAHLVIPSAVVRELSSFKKEKSERGKAARIVLKRIRELSERQISTMGDAYSLERPLKVSRGDQLISVLPVHTNFKQALPFRPSEDDMDGQIILATLTVMFLEKGYPIDGTARPSLFEDIKSTNVTLLTNDNGLAIRARERGIKTSRFGYKCPDPYTGRRDLVVPEEMFTDFFSEKRLDRVLFEAYMPNELPLVANEFIVMSLDESDNYPRSFDPNSNPYFLHIGRYDQGEDAIVPLRYASSFPVGIQNPGQAIYAEALMDPNYAAVICTGPAGSGKTYMPTIYGYEACKNGEYIGITIVPCKSQSDIGALPGELNEKMSLDIQIIKNALRNYLLKEDSKFRREIENLKKFGSNAKTKKKSEDDDDGEAFSKRSIKTRLEDRVDLIWDNWFSCIPVENARGRDFAHEFALYDEFQDQSIALADTLIKRIGCDGKIVIAGDLEQQRAPYLDLVNNGLVYVAQLLFNDPMVARVHFTEDEVIRHPLVRAIAERQKNAKSPNSDEEKA